MCVWFSLHIDACVHTATQQTGDHTLTVQRKKVREEEWEAEITADKGGNVTYCSVGFTAAEMGLALKESAQWCAAERAGTKPQCSQMLEASAALMCSTAPWALWEPTAEPHRRAELPAGRHTGRGSEGQSCGCDGFSSANISGGQSCSWCRNNLPGFVISEDRFRE